MTLERFEALALAWGGDITRWPSPEQAAARALVGLEDAAARALRQAAALDAALDASPNIAPSPALRRAVLAGAPRPRRGLRALGAWASGLSLAAACAAGVACGVLVAEPGARDSRAEAMLQAASDLGAASTPVDLGGGDV